MEAELVEGVGVPPQILKDLRRGRSVRFHICYGMALISRDLVPFLVLVTRAQAPRTTTRHTVAPHTMIQKGQDTY